MKKILAILLAGVILLSFVGCSNSKETETSQNEETQAAQEVETTETTTETTTEVQYQTVNEGDTVTSEDWSIELTDAYTSRVLESSESSTSWEPADGYAFLILEFDVTCLNSTKPTIGGKGITNPVATVDGNTYSNWEYQYVSAQIWCNAKNIYLEANLPLHVYVYTYIPEASIDNNVTINLNIAGQPSVISVN